MLCIKAVLLSTDIVQCYGEIREGTLKENNYKFMRRSSRDDPNIIILILHPKSV